jgi:hypothetical protein
MAFKRKSSGSFVDIASVKRRSGGAWVGVSTVKRRVSGAWVTVWSSLSVSTGNVSRTFTNSPASNSPATRTFATLTSVTASGGDGSFAWTRVSGSTLITATSPSAATTTFTVTNLPIGTNVSAIFRVTSAGATQDVTVSMTYESGL